MVSSFSFKLHASWVWFDLHAGQLQADALGIRYAARGDEDVTALDRLLARTRAHERG